MLSLRPDTAPNGRRQFAPEAAFMRRADRLFQIVQLIRGRRLSTAAFLAERLGSLGPHHLHCDVADLQHRACPLRALRPVWATPGRGPDLPPLMFSQVGSQCAGGRRLAQTLAGCRGWPGEVEGALGKIPSVLPPAASRPRPRPCMPRPLGGPARPGHPAKPARGSAQPPRGAGGTTLTSTAAPACPPAPAGLLYWGKVWTLSAWCELRNDFRGFRIDRVSRSPCWTSSSGRSPARLWRTCCARWRGDGGRAVENWLRRAANILRD